MYLFIAKVKIKTTRKYFDKEGAVDVTKEPTEKIKQCMFIIDANDKEQAHAKLKRKMEKKREKIQTTLSGTLDYKIKYITKIIR